MDQGLGLGTGFPLFNRATASLTRFLQLRPPPPGGKKPPPVLVVHGKGGHAVGDLASYDYFTLGGPYSVLTPNPIPSATLPSRYFESLYPCRLWWCMGWAAMRCFAICMTASERHVLCGGAGAGVQRGRAGRMPQLRRGRRGAAPAPAGADRNMASVIIYIDSTTVVLQCTESP